MNKGTVTLGFLSLALFAGCRGEVGGFPVELITYKFEAKVAINPTQPVPNRPLNLSLEVTSSSNRAVQTDILLKVVSDGGETLYESRWPEVLFHEHEVWDLQQAAGQGNRDELPIAGDRLTMLPQPQG